MNRIAGILLVILSSTACAAGVDEVKLREEIEGAYWIVSDRCGYSMDDAALSQLIEGKERYHHLKVQANGLPRAKVFQAVESQIDEQLARMEISCPAINSPGAVEQLQSLGRRLTEHLDSIDRLLRKRKR